MIHSPNPKTFSQLIRVPKAGFYSIASEKSFYDDLVLKDNELQWCYDMKFDVAGNMLIERYVDMAS